MSDNGSDFLSANASAVEYLQDDDLVYGYDYNRIVDALTGNRNGLVTINSNGTPNVVLGPTGISGINSSGGTTFGVTASGLTTIAHNDTWVNSENVDPAFPGRLSYIIPGNSVKVIEAFLSFKLLTYRTYNTLSFSNTGAGTAHSHPFGESPGTSTDQTVFTPFTDGLGTNFFVAPAFLNVTLTTYNESSHTHPISGSSVLGISEGSKASNVSISIDGTDITAAVGGPFNSDIVELNILNFFPVTQGLWHTILLSSATLGQIQSHLRVTVLVTANP